MHVAFCDNSFYCKISSDKLERRSGKLIHVRSIVQLKGISAIREAYCTGIQLLIAITDAERAEKVTLTFEGHRV